MDIYQYECDDEYQYSQINNRVIIQTRAGAATEILFDHTYGTTDEASKDLSTVVAGRAKNKGMQAIIATLAGGTAKAQPISQQQAVQDYLKIIQGQATYIARNQS